MFDFTLKIYKHLLHHLSELPCLTFATFVESTPGTGLVLRHDVDKRPQLSLSIARVQQELGVRGTYYFRIVKESFDTRVMEEMAEMGHEIGYHYEDLALVERVMKREKGKADGSPESGVRKSGVSEKFENEILERGIESFEQNLARMREVADIQTICMHGSPMSRWDSRMLWERYDYRDYGLIGEPYFDIDFDSTAYYTDTGRRWDGEKVSVRDKPMEPRQSAVGSRQSEGEAGTGKKEKGERRTEKDRGGLYGLRTADCGFPVFHSTFDMIRSLERGEFPVRAMLTFHPQRWTDRPGLWVRELVEQNVKNVIKKGMVRRREKG